MSSDFSILPRKWFAIAAAAALLLALTMVGVLLRPDPVEAPAVSQEPGPGSGDPGPSEIPAPPSRPPISLRQVSEDGTLIPWGDVVTGNFVRLEVSGVEPGSVDLTEWRLAKDGAAFEQLDGSELSAELSSLEPGRYRWNVALRRSDLTEFPVLEPPRIDPASPDFVVAPSVLELRNLRQTQLDGQPIPKTLRTPSGARLAGDVRYPGAVLEVEVKRAGEAFDGAGLQTVPAEEGEPTELVFQDSVGSYRWRARAVQGQQRTDWQEMRLTEKADFIVFNPASPRASSDPDPRASASRTTDNASMRISSGRSGRSGPLPHSVQKLDSLWSLMVSVRGLAVALVPISLLVALLWRQSVRAKQAGKP